MAVRQGRFYQGPGAGDRRRRPPGRATRLPASPAAAHLTCDDDPAGGAGA